MALGQLVERTGGRRAASDAVEVRNVGFARERKPFLLGENAAVAGDEVDAEAEAVEVPCLRANDLRMRLRGR
jgi:hypothetical protein